MAIVFVALMALVFTFCASGSARPDASRASGPDLQAVRVAQDFEVASSDNDG
jgi:hypothetical protein